MSLSPEEIIVLINLAEQLAVLINNQITASNSAEEQVAWTASQQFYLQGLNALKSRVADESPTVQSAP